MSEDDFSCPICLNLLVDPVVGSCGHDFCELCFRRWAVDQRKRSCPSCRKPLAGELPGVCLRLARTVEALFPQRSKERQAEVAEDRRALAAEKRAKEEAARREAAAQQAAAPAFGLGGDLLMHAVIRFQSGPLAAGSRQAAAPLVAGLPANMPALRFAMPHGNGPQPAASGVLPAAAAAGRGAAQAAAAWPMGPPLNEMEFNMGWHDASEAHSRRRRQPHGRR
ncbi:hypothetical protein ABPG75_008694 [Micractinium tetrahymenae]